MDGPAAVLHEHERPVRRRRPDARPDRRAPPLVARHRSSAWSVPSRLETSTSSPTITGVASIAPAALNVHRTRGTPVGPETATAGARRVAAPARPGVRRRHRRAQQRAREEGRADEQQRRSDEQDPAPPDADHDPRRQHHRRRGEERHRRGQRSHPLRLPEDLREQPLRRQADVLGHRGHQGALERAVGRCAHACRSRIAEATRSGSSPSVARRVSSARWRRDFAVPTGTPSTAAAWVSGRSR